MNNGYFVSVLLVVVGIAFLCLIAFLNFTFDKIGCRRDAIVTMKETMIAGSFINYDCYIKVDGEWLPRDRWRVIEE